MCPKGKSGRSENAGKVKNKRKGTSSDRGQATEGGREPVKTVLPSEKENKVLNPPCIRDKGNGALHLDNSLVRRGGDSLLKKG